MSSKNVVRTPMEVLYDSAEETIGERGFFAGGRTVLAWAVKHGVGPGDAGVAGSLISGATVP